MAFSRMLGRITLVARMPRCYTFAVTPQIVVLPMHANTWSHDTDGRAHFDR